MARSASKRDLCRYILSGKGEHISWYIRYLHSSYLSLQRRYLIARMEGIGHYVAYTCFVSDSKLQPPKDVGDKIIGEAFLNHRVFVKQKVHKP